MAGNTRRSSKRPLRCACVVVAAFYVLLLLPSPHARESVLNFDPAQTKIDVPLGDVLHTVRGAFKLKSGQIRFDSVARKANGAVIVDATSGDGGNKSRDKKMHKEVLESQKFPEIVFIPNQVKGAISPTGTSQVEVLGVFRLQGKDHEMTLTFSVQLGAGGQLQPTAYFSVPFVAWGLHDASMFILRVDKTVDIDMHATVQLVPAQLMRG